MMNATKMAVDEINSDGGINGKEINLIEKDNQSDPGTGTQQARELINQENVMITLGGMASGMRNAVLPVHADNEVPYFYATSYEGGVCREIEGIGDYVDGINVPKDLLEWGFFTGAVPSQQLNTYIPYLVDQHDTDSWYLIGADYLWPHAMHSVVKNLLNEQGVDVLGETYAPPANEDWETTISDIQDKEPDLVYTSLNAGMSPFLKQSVSLGVKGSATYASSGMTTPFARSIGDPADDVYASQTYFASVGVDGNTEFLQSYRDRYDGSTPSAFAVNCYTQVYIIKAAIEENNPEASTGPELRDALENSIEVQTPKGAVEMDPGTHHCIQNSYVGQFNSESDDIDILQTVEDVAPYGDLVEENCLGV